MPHLRTLLLVLAVATSALAGELRLADLLPPETPALIETTNPTPAELKQLAIYQCLEEPALKKALDQIFSGESTSQAMPLGSGALFVKTDMRDMSVELRFLQKSGSHSIRIKNKFAVAWVGLAQGAIPVDVVLGLGVVNPAESVEAVKRIIVAVLDSVGTKGAQFATVSYGGAEYTSMTIEPVTLYLATLGDLLIVTTTEARIRDCVDRSKSVGRGPSLANSERYKGLVNNARGTGSATTVMAFQVDRALEILSEVAPGPMNMARGGMGSMGLGGLKTLSSVSRVDGRGISNTMSILLDRVEGGPMFRPGQPTKAASLAFAPKNALYVNCMNLGGDTLAAFLANPMVAGMFERKFGLRLKEDLLDLLGDEVGIVVAPNEGLIPDIGLILQCRDAARLEKSLLQMAEKVDWPVGTGVQHPTIRGVKSHVLPLMHPQLGGVPLAPSFGVIGDALVVAPSPISLRRFVAVRQGDKPNITANPDFARLREMVPANAEGMSYLNLPRLVAFCYDTFVPILQSIPQPKGSNPIFELPDSEVFTRHIYGRIAWTHNDENGWHWVSHAPMDMSGFMLAGVAVAGGLLFLVSGKAEEAPLPVMAEPDRVAMTCAANVRMLAARLRYYRRQHKALPEKLADLEADYLPEDVFVVPGTDKRYVYLGPEGSGPVLLHGHPNGHDGRICVLTKTMKVRRVTPAALEKLLSAQSVKEPR